MVQVLYDLLSPVPGTPESLQIIDDDGATVVKGLTQVQVSTQEQALALLFEGNMPFHDHCVVVSLYMSLFAAEGEGCILLFESMVPQHCSMFMCSCYICIISYHVDQSEVSLCLPNVAL